MGSVTVDQIIAVIASVGACSAAVATFLTVLQIAKQRKASYRPELTLSRTLFDASVDPITGCALPNLWVKVSTPGEAPLPTRTRGFALELSNIGLGAAKNISVSWSFPFRELVRETNDLAQRALVPAYFTFENDTLSLHSEVVGEATCFWKNQKKAYIDYVLSAAVQHAAIALDLPSAYIYATSGLIYFTTVNKQKETFPDIPLLKLDIEYLDIADGKHRASFDIRLDIVMIVANGSGFRGYLEAKKVS